MDFEIVVSVLLRCTVPMTCATCVKMLFSDSSEDPSLARTKGLKVPEEVKQVMDNDYDRARLTALADEVQVICFLLIENRINKLNFITKI